MSGVDERGEPTESCPWCGATCYADWVDVGFGTYGIQCGPFYCENCRASQIGAFDKPRELTADEQRHRWYAPGSPLGSSVNAVAGKPVSVAEARMLYRAERRFGVKLLDPIETRSPDDEDGGSF